MSSHSTLASATIHSIHQASDLTASEPSSGANSEPSSEPSSDRDQKAERETQRLWEIDKKHAIHPWVHFSSFEEEGSTIIERGEGAYVFDSRGRRYLDGIAGLWCVNIGHGRQEMAEAIAEQAAKLAYFSTFCELSNPPLAELSAKLCELTPDHLNHVYLASSGSAANDTAIRTIHNYFNRRGEFRKKKIISRAQAYHGTSYITMSLGGKPEDRDGFDFEEEMIQHVSVPDCYRRPEGSSEEEFCDQLVEELDAMIQRLGPDNVAAFFAEPVLGAGGVIVPPKGYHKRTQEVCRRYGVLTVSDEVVTGFGRLGHFFASESLFDLRPDIITSAKGISSGYIPLSATFISDEIYEVIAHAEKDSVYSHGYTYTGHPVACAAGLKNIEIMEREDLCGHVRKLGPYFEERLATLSDLPIVGDVRGSHFMLCIENVANKQTRELLPEEANIGKRIAVAAQQRGLMVRPCGHLNILSPPLIFTRDEIDATVAILRDSIEATMVGLERDGYWKESA